MRAPDGRVSLDTTGRAPGRGAYLCDDASCWDAARRRRALERALGVTLPDDVARLVAAGPAPHDDQRDHFPTTQPTTHEPQGGARGQE